MDIDPEDETLDTTQLQEAGLKHVGNEYHAKHEHFPVIEPDTILSNNPFSSAMASTSGQSFYDPYDLSSDDEED